MIEEVNGVVVYTCNKCKKSWPGREKRKDQPPIRCRHCLTEKWNEVWYNYECLRCHYEWLSTNEAPGVCPHCKNANWDKPEGKFRRR